MDTVYGIFIVLHLLSWAMVLGGWLATMRKPQVTAGMMHGSFAAFLFGIILTGLAMSDATGRNLDHMKIGVKGIVALAVIVLLAVAKRQLSTATSTTEAIAGGAPASAETAAAGAAGSSGSASATATAAPSSARMLINLAGILVVVNVAIAVLWT